VYLNNRYCHSYRIVTNCRESVPPLHIYNNQKNTQIQIHEREALLKYINLQQLTAIHISQFNMVVFKTSSTRRKKFSYHWTEIYQTDGSCSSYTQNKFVLMFFVWNMNFHQTRTMNKKMTQISVHNKTS
jgi:hypothetical protein